MKTNSRQRRLEKLAANVRAPKIINVSGLIFDNMRGGPYKYGRPLPATRENLAAVELGVL